MPPQVRVDREAIIGAAFALARAGGPGNVTARNIARELHCSTQPVFRVYQNMDALKKELCVHVNKFFAQYVMAGMEGADAFSSVGLRYIQFASHEANLFQMMFMSGSVESDNLVELFTSDPDNIEIMKSIPRFAGCGDDQIKDFFVKIAIFTHGVASLVATNDIPYDQAQISQLLGDLFRALARDINNDIEGNNHDEGAQQ